MALTPSWPGPNGVATTTDGRKALAGLIVQDAAGNSRAGIFPTHPNALVIARADMNVDIGIFEAAAVQFSGPILFTNDAVAQLPAVLVSPGAGITNFYVVYAKQNESTAPGTDANNNRVFGAQLSTTSFAAARAALPVGAVELGTIQMPTGKTATNQAGIVITPTHQYTAASGGTVWLRNQAEQDAFQAIEGQSAYRLDQKITVRADIGGWSVLAGKPGSTPFAKLRGMTVPRIVQPGSPSTSEITFPAGLFTVPPHVVATNSGNVDAAGVATVTGITTVKAIVSHVVIGGAPQILGASWVAEQASPISAVG